MLFLQSHHIVDLYCWVDDTISKPPPQKTGRPLSVSDSEVITMLIWNTVVLKQSTLKDIFDALCLYHQKDFPRLPKYSSFVSHCHRVLPQFIDLLEQLLQTSDIGIVDSSMIEVCKLHRSDSHKVAQGKA